MRSCILIWFCIQNDEDNDTNFILCATREIRRRLKLISFSAWAVNVHTDKTDDCIHEYDDTYMVFMSTLEYTYIYRMWVKISSTWPVRKSFIVHSSVVNRQSSMANRQLSSSKMNVPFNSESAWKTHWRGNRGQWNCFCRISEMDGTFRGIFTPI